MSRAALLFIFLAAVLSAHGQTNFEPYNVTTFAGVPTKRGAFNGVGAPDYFSGNTGVAVDATGTIYVADSGRHVIRKVSSNGVITTFAGAVGKPGSADGTAKVARFNFPAHLAVDSARNVYVADRGNHTIRRISPAGVVSTIAGAPGAAGASDGQGKLAHFDSPTGIAAGPGGELYVSDTNNHTIRRISPQGAVTTVAGLPGAEGSADGMGAAARFRFPAGVALDAAGELWVVDSWNFTIRKISAGDLVSTPLGTPRVSGTADGVGNAARFTVPVGLTFDGSGNLYITDSHNHTIRKVAPGFVVSTLAGNPSARGDLDGTGTAARFQYPQQIAFYGSTLYVSDYWETSKLRALTLDGVVTTAAGPSGFFDWPTGVALDSAGNLFVADRENHTIRKITPQGVVSTFAGAAGQSGTADGVGSAARFFYPDRLAVDKADNIYVTTNNGFRTITPAGVVTTIPGLNGRAVAVDAAGNIYVAGSGVIRKRSTSGAVTTLAGAENFSGCADGSGGAARFSGSSGMALDPNGNIYVSDQGSGTIRRVTADGVVTTIVGQCYAYGGVDGVGTAARLDQPTGLALDAAGNLFITEEDRIRRMKPDGTVTSLAGPVNTIGFRDGRGVDAIFYRPSAIAVSPTGSLFVADTNNNVIRRADPYTAVSRKAHGSSTFDVALPFVGTPAIESRSGGAAGEYQIVLNGYAPVTFSGANVTSGSGTVSSTSGNGSSTLVLNLSGVSTGQTIDVTVAGVNDGVSTSDITVPVSILVGDANSSGSVDSGDVLLTRTNSGQPTDVSNFVLDYNCDGSVNSGDALVVRSRSGTSLP